MVYEQKYIVQECWRDYPVKWWDDPDQPAETMSSLKQAIEWLVSDFEGCEGHRTDYVHRIIKQTTHECYSSDDIDVKFNYIK
jgi:hypothetical protein